MAFYTIEKRLRKDGTPRYRCTVGIKEGGVYKYRESKTFARQALAKSWGAKRVSELEIIGIPTKDKGESLSSLIERFIAHPDLKPSYSKETQLRVIQRTELGGMRVADIKSTNYVEFARWLRATERSPKTVTEYYGHIATVLEAACPFFGVKVDSGQLDEAKLYSKKKKISGRSNKRSRRPSSEEVELLHSELKKKRRSSYKDIPFDDIFELSILSCMRIGEICKILKSDIDENQRAILVRDRKDAVKKVGNHMLVPLLGRAWDIVNGRPDSDDGRLFPYRSKTISEKFSIICKELGIDDLHYHDLRREGASRLFEMGFSIEEVAQVTGHRNLQTLWTVYTELYPKNLHNRFDELQRKKEKKDD
ncbi:site-specific integrase [Salmonella enterica]|nr:site-specific integrase [Salmonella enterica]